MADKIVDLKTENEKLNKDHLDLQSTLDLSMTNFNELQETYDALYKKLPNKQELDLLEKLKSFKAFKNQTINLKFDNKMNFSVERFKDEYKNDVNSNSQAKT